MIGPPHTFESMVQELRQGLLDGNIALPHQPHYAKVFAQHLDPERLGVQLEAFIATQKSLFERELELQTKQATEYHRISLLASTFGFVLILGAIAFSLSERLPSSFVSIAGGAIAGILSAFFGRHADKDHERIKSSLREVGSLVQMKSLLELSASFEDAGKRDQNRQAVFEAFLQHMDQDRLQNIKEKASL